MFAINPANHLRTCIASCINLDPTRARRSSGPNDDSKSYFLKRYAPNCELKNSALMLSLASRHRVQELSISC